MGKLEIKKGMKFGELEVIKELPTKMLPSGQPNRVFLMKCSCGNTKEIRLLHFVRGRIKTCGHDRHGDTGSQLHNTWRGMSNRCKEYHSEHHLYYDKGVRLCSQWKKYNAFKKWALENGYEDGLTIDRIDNNGNYEPDNCRFVSQALNNLNRNNTLFVATEKGEKPLLTVLKNIGLEEKYHSIYWRIKNGWSIEDAIHKPIKS